jgi:hypothetical protein
MGRLYSRLLEVNMKFNQLDKRKNYLKTSCSHGQKMKTKINFSDKPVFYF